MIGKDAINILKGIQQENLEENDFLGKCAIDMAVDALKENESLAKSVIEASELLRKIRKKRPHGEWIPCSERLPEDDRPVLIYAWNVHHVVARYGQFRTEDGGYKNAWVTAGAWFDNTEIKHKVIAWMPLPEPYREETRE